MLLLPELNAPIINTINSSLAITASAQELSELSFKVCFHLIERVQYII